MDISKLDYYNIQEIVLKKRYEFYTKPYSLNIIGIRATIKNDNRFNDIIYILYKDDEKNNHVFKAVITTLPGFYYLENPMIIKGCAILKPGQYKSCWQTGIHSNDYKALVQIGKMTVYRDNNKDDITNTYSGTEDTGYFGINLHYKKLYSETIDMGSAGCQVFKNKPDFEDAMILFDMQKKETGIDTFTYTLLEEKDFL